MFSTNTYTDKVTPELIATLNEARVAIADLIRNNTPQTANDGRVHEAFDAASVAIFNAINTANSYLWLRLDHATLHGPNAD